MISKACVPFPCIISLFQFALGQVFEEPESIEAGEIIGRGRECTFIPAASLFVLGHPESGHRSVHTSLPGQLSCPRSLCITLYSTKNLLLFFFFLFSFFKLVSFLYARTYAKLQESKDKQDNSYLEGPYSEVPACLIKGKRMGPDGPHLPPFQRKHHSFPGPPYILSSSPGFCFCFLPLVTPKRKTKQLGSRSSEKYVCSTLSVTSRGSPHRSITTHAGSLLASVSNDANRKVLRETEDGARTSRLAAENHCPPPHPRSKSHNNGDNDVYSVALYTFSTHPISALFCS